MPVTTTLFAATVDELAARFGNPTSTDLRDTVRAPSARLASLDADYDAVIPPVLEPLSTICRRLEDLAPRRLRALPHIVMTPAITGLELGSLAAIFLEGPACSARVVDASESGVVDAFPSEALTPLASLADASIEETARRWGRALQSRGRRVDTWSLVAVRALARAAVARGANLFAHARG